jgi:membrane protease YdiL (CAAX protease family)
MFRKEAIFVLVLLAAPAVLGSFGGIVLLLGAACLLFWVVARRAQRAPAITGATAPGARPFSPWVTGLAVVVLGVAAVAGAWLLYATPRQGSAVSAEALPLVVSRTLELRDAVGAASSWERRIFEWLAGDAAAELKQAIAWYEELATQASEPHVENHLLVLLGEAGQSERLRARIAANGPGSHELIRIAYLGTDAEAAGRPFDREQAAALGEGWFIDRLAQRWARRGEDSGLLAAAQESARARARPLLGRLRVVAAVHVLLFVAGAVGLAVALQRQIRGPDGLAVSSAPLPPPWSGWAGVVVLVRGGALATLVLAALYVGLEVLSVPPSSTYFLAAVYILTFAPVMLLAERRLLRPQGLVPRSAFGLRVPPRRAGRVVLVVLAVVGLTMLGDLVLALGASALRLEVHWTEWWDSDLVWGEPADAAAMLLMLVVLAPFFEESVFRGLLFATLRRRWRFAAAALVSAGLFAVGHGYGVAGSASILLSGLTLAWAYEATGSLVPGMLAHATFNLLATLPLVWLLRG